MPASRNTTLNATAVVIHSSGKSKLKCITVERIDGATQDLYLQVYDAANATVGTTVPNDVIFLKAPVDNKKSTFKVVYAGKYGGKLYSTGLVIACTTTATGSTNPTAGQEPTVTVNWEPAG